MKIKVKKSSEVKKPINEMRLVISSSSANESFARTAVSAFVAQLDPTIEEIADIKTAVSEAVTNCIVHAYRNTIGQIYINVRVFSGGRVCIRIRDTGCGIENIPQAMEPLFTTGGSERAGLGFAVMESFMDGLKVRSNLGKGTTVSMEKVIARRIKYNVGA
ncbi:MAG: anti-sigma F factor [Oscillospiraceae bacterium]|jgi:stage II sporulation protein AB (anti-sigma F factor)|nr:anti-sigma F factor [Oscillospiraceae bacterium]